METPPATHSASGGAEPFTLEFPALDALGFCRSVFIGRTPGIDVLADRETALARLRQSHDQTLASRGFNVTRRASAEQIHGSGVAAVTGESVAASPVRGVDALATGAPGLCLSIYVADCAAIYFADPRRRVIALAHSGRKGTELNIVGETIALMADRFGSVPANLTIAVSPCIRPPYYEVDFAAQIAAQARACGAGSFHDDGLSTASNAGQFYSYRLEKGRTGRMLAAIEIIP